MPAKHSLMSPYNPLLKLGLCLSLVFSACQTDKVAPTGDSGSGAGPKIFRPDGTPAAGARVQLVPVDNNPKPGLAKEAAGVYKLETNADGKYDLTGVPAGQYNVFSAQGDFVALQDSVRVNDGPATIKNDTLALPGTLSGFVALQPNHNSNSALVQLLGTTVYTNVGEDGRFEIGGLAAGSYAAVISTSLSDYSALFTGFSIKAGARTDRKDTLRPPYQGVPLVTGLHVAMIDTVNSRVKIAWNPSRRTDLLGYAVLRDSLNAPRIQGQPINRSRLTDTQYVDTLGSMFSGGVPEQAWEYRVIVQTKSGKFGEWFESVGVRVPPPSALMTIVTVTPKAPTLRLGESGQIIAVFSSPYRKISALTWTAHGMRAGEDPTRPTLLPYTDTLKIVRYASAAGSGADTLRYTAGLIPETVSLVCVATNDAGIDWPADIRIDVVHTPPAVQVSPDTIVMPGTVLHLRGRGTDMFGKPTKLEWDIGGTGVFVPTARGDTDVTVPNHMFKLFPCILRVTDEYGGLILNRVLKKSFRYPENGFELAKSV